MNLDFELILFYAVIVSGIISLFDILFLAKKRPAITGDSKVKLPMIIDYARSFFPVLLFVFLLRSFLYEPFRIPTGSLKPTLLVGDFILVNKFDYGIRLPVLHTKLFKVGEPQHGDIFVFRFPPKPSVDFVKRVIGVPGDHISYINKVLYINGQKIPQVLVHKVMNQEGDELQHTLENQEDFMGVKHAIFINENKPNDDIKDIVVPKGMYFAMGDNRDNSADSRYWGFVPEENIVGKANLVWLSWDSLKTNIRWDRLGKLIH